MADSQDRDWCQGKRVPEAKETTCSLRQNKGTHLLLLRTTAITSSADSRWHIVYTRKDAGVPSTWMLGSSARWYVFERPAAGGLDLKASLVASRLRCFATQEKARWRGRVRMIAAT